MTANSATLCLFHLDRDASVIEAAAKRVRVAALDGGIVALGGIACVYLKRAQTRGNKLRRLLSGVHVSTAEQRDLLKEIANNLGKAAVALDDAYVQSERRHVDKWPVFGAMLLKQLEDLSCTFEDMAETAALASSEAFTAELHDQLHRNIKEETRQRAARAV